MDLKPAPYQWHTIDPHCNDSPEPNMRSCKAQWLLIAVVVVLGTLQMLASCGQKGDLYLPDDDTAEERR